MVIIRRVAGRCRLIATAVLIAAATPAGAAAPPACLDGLSGEVATVTSVDAAGVLTLAEGGSIRQADVRLLSGGEIDLATPRRIRFYRIRLGPDRWGRLVGHVIDDARDAWLAETWIAAGRAAVDPQISSPACLAPLLKSEARARRQRRGRWGDVAVIWAGDPALRVRGGQFTLVEGRVLSLGKTRKTHYLNFGSHFASDFTATIAMTHATAFYTAGIDPTTLRGVRVRVRGVVDLRGGPSIVLDHPSQLELLTMGPGVR